MLHIWTILTAFVASIFGTPELKSVENAISPIYAIKVKTLDGKETTLEKYKGKKMLIVNVASKCGYTPQYADLQILQEQHSDKLVVLGFPCNQFGKQESGTNSEIASFCKLNYGVSFPMFDKISVKKGDDQHPLYQWLSDKKINGKNDDAPKWNFAKYLIDEKGELIKFYGSAIKPLSEELMADILKK